jgi:thiosulfate dehydrogenase
LPLPATKAEETNAPRPVWTPPDIGSLPYDARGDEIRRGRDLVTATYAHIGPNVSDPAKHFAGNNLACTNCHLEAGTKKYGLPIYGLIHEFPAYSARIGADISIEDRLNSCMTRSMNGRALPNDAPEMRALVAYVKFLSTGVAPGQEAPGHGAGKIPELTRAADPVRGKGIYERACLSCHNSDGSGIARDPGAMALGYAMPPLWGNDSFNDGAGMARLSNFANFVHFNMPHGTDYTDARLTPEEAWDVAAYVLSQPRQNKARLDKDFPDLLKKPVDTPYGPYADHFSETQHKFGPFGPIGEEIARLEAEAAKPH